MSWGRLARDVDALRTEERSRRAATRHLRSVDAQLQAAMAAQMQPSTDPTGVPALVAVVRLIASTINQLPITVTRLPEVPEWLRAPRTNRSELDLYDLLQYTVSSMAVRGHAYLRCIRIGEGWRIDAVHPDRVAVSMADGDIVQLHYQLNGRPVDRVPYNRSDTVPGETYLLPIPYLVTPEAPWGTSPVQLARDAFAGYATTEAYAADLFGGGTHSGGMLTTENEITADTALRMQEQWVSSRQTGKIPVLGAGLTYTNTVMSARDAAWIEARAFNGAQVAQMYGCPPDYLGQALVGGSSSLSYSNAQDNDMRFRRNCIAPFCEQMSDALSTLLPPGRNEAENVRVIFDYSRWESPPGRGDDDAPAADGPMADPGV